MTVPKSVVCAFKVFSANILDFVIISTIPLFTKVDIGGRGLPFRAVTWPLFLIKRGKIWKNHNHTMTLHKFCKKSTLTFLLKLLHKSKLQRVIWVIYHFKLSYFHNNASRLKIFHDFVVMGRTMFEVQCPIVRSPKLGVWVRSSIDEHVWVRSMFEKWCSRLFYKMVFDPSLWFCDWDLSRMLYQVISILIEACLKHLFTTFLLSDKMETQYYKSFDFDLKKFCKMFPQWKFMFGQLE